MPYGIVFQRDTKAELQEAQNTYGGAFREETNAWLVSPAASAEQPDSPLSVDLAELIAEAAESDLRSWPRAWRRWMQVPLREKFRALLTLVKQRCRPKWKSPSSSTSFKPYSSGTRRENR